GTEATRLMVDHAFGTLGLHRVALSVFEFNERAIRAYTSCGFLTEGRAREAVWRDGRWWDELSMSVLAPEWHARRRPAARRLKPARLESAAPGPAASASGPPAPSAPARSAT